MFFVFMDHLFLWSKTYLEPPEGLASQWGINRPVDAIPFGCSLWPKGFWEPA